MYSKLALRNMKRSFSDYAIYFITIMLATSLMFAFNSIIFTEELLNLADNMQALSYSFVVLSIILVIVLAFMVNYATRFIIKKRKREFGTYLLLGMERRTVARMFLLENVVIGILSFLAGIVVGTLLFQLFSIIIMNIFDQTYQIKVVLSLKAVGLTALYFVLMYMLALIGGGRLIAKLKIYDLIYSSKYNEGVRYKHPLLYSVLFVVFSGMCAGGIYGLKHIFDVRITDNSGFLVMFGSIGAVVAGIYGIYVCLASFIALLQSKMKRYRYHHTNLFLVRQILSKIQTNSRVMGVHAVVLTLSLVFLTMGLSFGQGFKATANSDAPFDMTIVVRDPNVTNFEDVVRFIDAKIPVVDSVDYKLYRYEHEGYESIAFLRLSDYNQLRRQLQLDEKELTSGQFIVHVELSTIRESIIEQMKPQLEIELDGTRLTSGEELLFSEPIEQYQTNAFEQFTFVVPDAIADASLTPVQSILVATSQDGAPGSLKSELRQYLYSDWKPSEEAIDLDTARPWINIRDWVLNNSLVSLTTLSFGAMYMSFVFFLIVATVLSMHQLTDSAEHKYRFDLLRKLGVENREINRLVLKQLALYFMFPIIVPIIVTVVMTTIMNQIFFTLVNVENMIFNNMFIALGSFSLLYLCFFIATYVGFKRNIS